MYINFLITSIFLERALSLPSVAILIMVLDEVFAVFFAEKKEGFLP